MPAPIKININEDLLKKIIQFTKIIDEKYPIDFAYIFGSYSRGDNTENSDLDLAFYFNKNYSDMEDCFNRGSIIEEGKDFFLKEVDIVSISKASPFLRYEIIRDGIVIKDGIDRASMESLWLREYFDFKYFSDIYDEAMVKRIRSGHFFEED
jgi:predicted nucleotidyltransferase